MSEETNLDDTDELCPDCLESVEDCECDDDEDECEECGELLEECLCDPLDDDEEGDECDTDDAEI